MLGMATGALRLHFPVPHPRSCMWAGSLGSIHEFTVKLLSHPSWLSCSCDRAEEAAFPSGTAGHAEKEKQSQRELWLPAAGHQQPAQAAGHSPSTPKPGEESRTSHRGSALAGTPSRPCRGGRSRRPCGSGRAAWHPCNPSARHRLEGHRAGMSGPDGHTGLTLSRVLSPG